MCLRRRGYTYNTIVSMDIIILSRLTMSVKQEVIDIKGEENEENEPQYPCPMCAKRFFGMVTLGRHMVRKECTKPDIKPRFVAKVRDECFIVPDSSDEEIGRISLIFLPPLS